MAVIKTMEALSEGFREQAKAALAAMREDKFLHDEGYPYVVVLETRRLLTVQMAYAVRGRFKALPGDPYDTEGWVRAFFREAGIPWVPSDAECTTPSTWTLQSKHIDGEAFDAAPSKDGVYPAWAAPDIVWERMATIAEAYGLAAGRRWKNHDSPHFQKKG